MKIPLQVKQVTRLEKKSLVARGLKLNEEAGELAAEILRFEGMKSANGKSKEEILDAIHLEAVDCMLMAFDILVHTGASDKKVEAIMNSQLKKWRKGLNERTN